MNGAARRIQRVCRSNVQVSRTRVPVPATASAKVPVPAMSPVAQPTSGVGACNAVVSTSSAKP